jgi:ABC-type phosphate transport system substrate-binding protein
MEELGDIYREGGKIAKWSELGVKAIPGAKGDDIIRVSRQNNSGTYHYFRETVVGKKNDFKQGSLDMNGSKDVVEQVTKTPGAIGYSGLGYATADVKILKGVEGQGRARCAAEHRHRARQELPILASLFMYTPGAPSPDVKKYLEWTLSESRPEGGRAHRVRPAPQVEKYGRTGDEISLRRVRGHSPGLRLGGEPGWGRGAVALPSRRRRCSSG